jgi:putative redox protein
LLIFHSPIDATVGIENAAHIFQMAKHPKSFVSLDDADHILSRKPDAIYVAAVIAAWAERYIGDGEVAAKPSLPDAEPGTVVVQEAGEGKFAQDINIGGKFPLRADEPESYGGTDTGGSPYDLLLAGLGACKSMTMRMYADRKKMPLERAKVTLKHNKIHAEDCEACETTEGKVDQIEVDIELTGDLTDEERQKIYDISYKCPVHRTLESEVSIASNLKI